jgi:hypothetical protein
LIREPEPSRISRTRDGHGTSEVQEDKVTCKPGTLIVDGGNCSNGSKAKVHSRTCKTKRDLTFKEEETEKETMSKFTEETCLQLRSGRSSTKIKLKRSRLKASLEVTV